MNTLTVFICHIAKAVEVHSDLWMITLFPRTVTGATQCVMEAFAILLELVDGINNEIHRREATQSVVAVSHNVTQLFVERSVDVFL